MAWSKTGWTDSNSQQWTRLRRQILRRDHGTCQARDQGCQHAAREVDHIVARSKGGTDDPTNLRAICTHCHRAKTGREGAAARTAANNAREAAGRGRRRPPEKHPGLID